MGDWIPVVAAVAGGAIAATASYFTGRVEARRQREARAEEGQRQREMRAEDRAEAARAEVIALRRATYTELYAAMRQYRSGLNSYLEALRPDVADMNRAEQKHRKEDARKQLEAARANTGECYSNAQMILPAPVLDLAREAVQRLGHTYRAAMGGNESGPEVSAYVRDVVDPALQHLREALRADLGIARPLSEF